VLLGKQLSVGRPVLGETSAYTPFPLLDKDARDQLRNVDDRVLHPENPNLDLARLTMPNAGLPHCGTVALAGDVLAAFDHVSMVGDRKVIEVVPTARQDVDGETGQIKATGGVILASETERVWIRTLLTRDRINPWQASLLREQHWRVHTTADGLTIAQPSPLDYTDEYEIIDKNVRLGWMLLKLRQHFW
jgi:hypothetical protein